MRGKRTRIAAAWVGVFALLLQLFLSFGHVHAQSPFVTRSLAVLAHTDQAKSDQAKSTPNQDQLPSGIPSDDCPICATLHMAGSGLLPPPVSVEHPAVFIRVSHQVSLEAIVLGVTRHFLFQTRAPPIA